MIDEVSSRGVIAVGAYQSAESYRINNGATVARRDNLHLVGSFGPAGNGALKPDLMSPSEIISTDAGYKTTRKGEGSLRAAAGTLGRRRNLDRQRVLRRPRELPY